MHPMNYIYQAICHAEQSRCRIFTILPLLVSIAFMLIPDDSYAEECTGQATAVQTQSASSGVITAIMKIISSILKRASKILFTDIVGHPYYTAILGAAFILTVVIYGTMVVFDLANLKPGEIVTRIFKLGLVAAIASPGGWVLLTDIVMKFFLGGMAELVNLFLVGAVQASGWGNTSGSLTFDPNVMGEPLAVLGLPLAQLFGTKFAIVLLGLFEMAIVELNGICFFILLVILWAAWNLLLALFNAIFVYIKSIVGLWFLMALSPIFIICLLYQTTRDLFQGWLNMVINFALQPILLFGFFAFFLVMINVSLANILDTRWCIETVDSWLFGLDMDIWRPRGGPGWSVPEGTQWLSTGASSNPSVQFPVQMMDILFLLLSTYLGLQYAHFVPQMTTRLSQNGLALGAGLDDTRQFFNARGWTPEAITARAISTAGGGLSKAGDGAMALGSRLLKNRGTPGGGSGGGVA